MLAGPLHRSVNSLSTAATSTQRPHFKTRRSKHICTHAHAHIRVHTHAHGHLTCSAPRTRCCRSSRRSRRPDAAPADSYTASRPWAPWASPTPDTRRSSGSEPLWNSIGRQAWISVVFQIADGKIMVPSCTKTQNNLETQRNSDHCISG